MADNVGYTPGVGASVAADEISGVLHQRVKISVGADGSAVDASSANPLPVDVNGEMIEAIEALRMAINSLTRTVGLTSPDLAGRRAAAQGGSMPTPGAGAHMIFDSTCVVICMPILIATTKKPKGICVLWQ
jgi:hypothetical protein